MKELINPSGGMKMKIGAFSKLTAVIVLLLTLILCSTAVASPAMPDDQTVIIEQSDTVAQIQIKIQAVITATGGSGNVTVMGSKNGAEESLVLDIPAGVTVVWRAEYSGGVYGFDGLITLNGEGRFEIVKDGVIASSGSRAIQSTCRVAIVVNGGTVEALNSSGLVINTYGDVSVIDGIVKGQGATVIYVAGDNSTVIVSGGTVSTTRSSAIYVQGGNSHISVSGGIVSSTMHTINIGGENSVVTVSGAGIVEATGKDSVAIYAGYHSTISIIGGLVKAEGYGCIAIDAWDADIYVSDGIVQSNGDAYLTTNIPIFSSAICTYTGSVRVSGNALVESTGDSSIAIQNYYGAIIVNGGTVRTTGNSISPYNSSIFGIYIHPLNSIAIWTKTGTLSVSGKASIEATGEGGVAIWAVEGDVTISGGSVKALGNPFNIFVAGTDITYKPAAIRTERSTVAICGNATVEATGKEGTAIYTDSGDVTVSGGMVIARDSSGTSIYTNSGNVTVSRGKVLSNATGINAFDAGSTITVTGDGEVQATVSGVYTVGDVIVNGGSISASAKYGCAIVSFGKVDISGGVVEESGERGCAISTGNSDVTISGGMVEASGEWSYAILTGGNVNVNDGNIKASGEKSNAICTYNEESTITISGNAIVSATTGNAIHSAGDVIIVGGTVESTGNTAFAIYASRSDIIVSGNAKVKATGDGGTAIYNWNGKTTVSGNALIRATGNTHEYLGNRTIPNAILTLDGTIIISGNANIEATGDGGNAINSYGQTTVHGGSVKATGLGGATINVWSYGVAAFLTGTCSGNLIVEDNRGLIVEVASLNAGAAGTTDGLTIKAGAVSAKWLAGGIIEFSLPYGIEPKTLMWGKTFEASHFAGTVLYQTSPREATVALHNSEGKHIDTAETDDDGAYSLTAAAGAGYTLTVTKLGYLSYTIRNLTLAEGEDIETIDIRSLAGDVNGDGIVNAVDLTCLLSEFNREPVEYKGADIDGNGIVNAADLTYLLAGFNKRNVLVYE
jgi:hypothetical protein